MTTSTFLKQCSVTPIFNTKAVARETTVPADTFRAWERRYGMPSPQRTAGGHRLYSERDIAVIRWLRDRTAEGMNISQAVLLLHNSLGEPELQPSAAPSVSNEPRSLQSLSNDFIESLVHFDSQRADHYLTEAFTLYPLEHVLLNLVQPTMIEIGERWHRGEVTVAAEHFSTQFVRRKLAAMVNLFDGDPSRAKIVVACAPNELHDVGALFVALFLARRGWHVIYLGAQLPVADLISTVEALRPDLICLSASMPETAKQISEAVRTLRDTFPNILVGYGGRIFNSSAELRSSVPGVFLGKDSQELVDNVASLLAQQW